MFYSFKHLLNSFILAPSKKWTVLYVLMRITYFPLTAANFQVLLVLLLKEIGEVSFVQNVKQFLLLGLEHIFTGYDHILFVISLLFGAKTIKNILSLITAFTIAHSITLVPATLEIVQLPGRFVESAIALSIIYVALINIFDKDAKNHPWLAFGFGLIHGFGFAGILSEIRLDGNHLATSLLSFNIGIELGQLLIVSLVFPTILWIKKLTLKHIKWVIPETSVAILAFGLVWFIQRAF